MPALTLGFIVNPLAGLGGSRGLKGSDGAELRSLVMTLSPAEKQRSNERAARAMQCLCTIEHVSILTWGGAMGGDLCASLGLSHRNVGQHDATLSAAADTRLAAEAIMAVGVDVLVFVGGDGTARDIFDVVGDSFPVLGVPAGVKMHSGVFAVSPEAAGELLKELAMGGLVGLRRQEVRDIDEDAFRHDQVRSRFYGDMQVPGEGRYLQHTKVGGRESQELVAADIAAWVTEQLDQGFLYIIGPGSTTAAIMAELGLDNTLLGVDVVRDRQLLLADANEVDLLEIIAEYSDPAKIFVTAIGGQGHVFGRGNQQLSPQVIRAVGVDGVSVVAAKSKISSLDGRPLLVDTNDPQLDAELCGYREVITGYDDRILYPVASMVKTEEA